MYINNTSETQSNEISGYILNFIDKAKENTSINYIQLLFDSIKQNLILALLLWLSGLTVIGIVAVYGIIAYRGFVLGYSLSSIIASLGIKNGCIFILSSMLLQNILFIPSIFAMAISRNKAI